MKAISKLLVLILFFIIILKSPPKASALVFPECKWDEITASCACPHAANMCADNTCSQCLQYKNDPRYYYLWKDIYCRKGTALDLLDKYKYSFVIPLLTTVVLELIAYALIGYRRTRELLYIALVNFLSFFVGIFLLQAYAGVSKYIPIPNIPFSLYGMNFPRLVSLLITGGLMVVFEALFLVYIAKFGDRKRIFGAAAFANIVSLVLGLGILNALYPHFLIPRIF